MMGHPRKKIRHAAFDILVAANICAGRGFANRPVPGMALEIPYFHVYFGDETAENDNQPPNYKRVPELNIEIILAEYRLNESGVMEKITGVLDDELDDIAWNVENAFLSAGRPYLKAPDTVVDGHTVVGDETVDSLEMTGTKYKLSSDGEMVIGSLVIGFKPEYRTRFPNEDSAVPVDDFNTGNVEIDSSGDGAAEITAQADLQVPPSPVVDEWEPSTAYVYGDVVRPTVSNGHTYAFTQVGSQRTGTSGEVEPAWPTDPAARVLDNDILWTEYGENVA